MKVISIWNPWATLVVKGLKLIETRSWAAPRSLVGQRIGIASTKQIRPDQRLEITRDEFAKHYAATDLPMITSGFADLNKFHNGYLLGTALLISSDVITEEDMNDITDEELAFGWFSPGRYAWRLRDAVEFAKPVSARGSQGIWEWFSEEAEDRAEDKEGKAELRRNLRVV